MDQKRSAIVKRIIKCFSCLQLSLTCVLSLNRQSFDQSAGCLTSRHSDVASNQHLAQNFNSTPEIL